MIDGTSEMSIMNKQIYWPENPQIRHHKVHWVNRISAQLVHSFGRVTTKGTNLIAVHRREAHRVHRVCSLWLFNYFNYWFKWLPSFSIIFKQKVDFWNCHLSFVYIYNNNPYQESYLLWHVHLKGSYYTFHVRMLLFWCLVPMLYIETQSFSCTQI